ncbi:hypothetical protein FHR99_003221 [Litorivivens lipolytica]|uniref:Uncharacterized protein n=1 Tax=Litorivivens lipolytica TaxID=1524264 RepID=A0A7W4Z764_9GAMM|nr:hypothetical protein [Litorivivens lipolytica]MBB3048947.1 hypothetical protein [Litorivivens lipolytica]
MLHKINENVADFVRQEQNSILRAGTGVSCHYFRGSFEGEYLSDRVWEKVSERGGIDVLWLGANPNAPESLARIVSQTDHEHYEAFLSQLEKRWICDVAPDDPDHWDPLSTVKHAGWKFYCDSFERAGGAEAIMFANIIPWGSKNIDSLFKTLDEKSPELLNRVLQFGDSQVRAMVDLLKPRYVLAPSSFCNHRRLRGVIDSPILGGPSYKFERRSVKPGKRAMNFAIRTDREAGITVVHAAHPSALRVTNQYRDLYFDEFTQILSEFSVERPSAMTS